MKRQIGKQPVIERQEQNSPKKITMRNILIPLGMIFFFTFGFLCGRLTAENRLPQSEVKTFRADALNRVRLLPHPRPQPHVHTHRHIHDEHCNHKEHENDN